MSSPIASVLITPAEAAALTRASQIEALASKAAEGAAPSGETSFAAALEAASASQEAGPEPEAMPSAAPESLPGAQAESVGGEAASSIAALGTDSTSGTVGEASAQAASAPDYASTVPTYASYNGLGSSYATGTSTGGGSPTAYESLIQQAAERNGVEPALLKGLIEQESGFDPSARSSAGAMGLTQLMPSTAASLGVTEPLNPAQSIEGGAKLLGELLRQFGGNVSYALAAYNAGAGAVQQYGGVPPYPETEAYVAKVLANAQSYR